MNTNTNMLRSKIVGATTLCALGALTFLPTNAVDARLVFSTEFESSTEDLNGDGNFTLSFGSDLAGEIYYDESADAFVINKSTTIQGDSTVTGDLDVDGATTLDNTTVDGTLTTNGDSNVTGNLDVDGNTTLDNTTVDGTLTTNGNATVTGTTNLQGATDIDSTLNVDGTSTFGSDITLNNDSQIINLRAENKTLANAPACTDASDLGRIFYDTDSNELLYCYQNGSNFGWSSTSGDLVNASATYYAEFANFSVFGDGSDNIGTMVAEYDDVDNRSFYKWSTRKTSQNDYDVVLQWQIPSDFQGFQSNSLEVDHKEGTNAGLSITVEDANNASIVNVSTANTATWTTETIDLTSASVAAGETITAKFKMSAQQSNDSFLSNVKINYIRK